MNPTVAKYYKKLLASIYSSKQAFLKVGPVEVATSYVSYGAYLLRNWSPRLSHHQLYTDAYTPIYMRYNAYIVYGMILSFLAYESISIKFHAEKKKNELIAASHQ